MSFSPELMDGRAINSLHRAIRPGNAYGASQPAGRSLLAAGHGDTSGLRGQSWRQPLCFSGHGVAPLLGQVDFAVAGHAVSDLRIPVTLSRSSSVQVNVLRTAAQPPQRSDSTVIITLSQAGGWIGDGMVSAFAEGSASGPLETSFTPRGPIGRIPTWRRRALRSIVHSRRSEPGARTALRWPVGAGSAAEPDPTRRLRQPDAFATGHAGRARDWRRAFLHRLRSAGLRLHQRRGAADASAFYRRDGYSDGADARQLPRLCLRPAGGAGYRNPERWQRCRIRGRPSRFRREPQATLSWRRRNIDAALHCFFSVSPADRVRWALSLRALPAGVGWCGPVAFAIRHARYRAPAHPATAQAMGSIALRSGGQRCDRRARATRKCGRAG